MRAYRLLASTAILLAACSQKPGNAAAVAHGGASMDSARSNVLVAMNGTKASAPDEAARNSNAPGRSADASHATVIGSLRAELVGTATLDGTPITDVALSSRCSTAFVTAKGTTTVDWSKVGNFAGDIEGEKATIPIDDGSGEHRFTMPNGATFRRVDGSMGLLADDCGGPS